MVALLPRVVDRMELFFQALLSYIYRWYKAMSSWHACLSRFQHLNELNFNLLLSSFRSKYLWSISEIVPYITLTESEVFSDICEKYIYIYQSVPFQCLIISLRFVSMIYFEPARTPNLLSIRLRMSEWRLNLTSPCLSGVIASICSILKPFRHSELKFQATTSTLYGVFISKEPLIVGEMPGLTFPPPAFSISL